jgi:hypothetical protein
MLNQWFIAEPEDSAFCLSRAQACTSRIDLSILLRARADRVVSIVVTFQKVAPSRRFADVDE